MINRTCRHSINQAADREVLREMSQGKTPEANIVLDEIDADIIEGEHFDRWEDIREAFRSGEMPPENQPQPTDAERDLITAGWIRIQEGVEARKQFQARWCPSPDPL